jgi:hypothetical protein
MNEKKDKTETCFIRAGIAAACKIAIRTAERKSSPQKIVKTFMICTHYQILLGSSNQGG